MKRNYVFFSYIKNLFKNKTTNRIISLIFSQLRYFSSNFFFFNIFQNSKTKNEENGKIIEIIDIVKSEKLSESFSCLKYTDSKVSFSLEKAYIVITDIIDSTKLYNQNPARMKQNIDIHDALARNLTKKHKGHIVGNEGDSFQIVFKHLDEAMNFANEFRNLLHQNNVIFKIRAGINKGSMCVRNFYGFKCYGKPIQETLEFLRHNFGNYICIKSKLLDRFDSLKSEIYCKH